MFIDLYLFFVGKIFGGLFMLIILLRFLFFCVLFGSYVEVDLNGVNFIIFERRVLVMSILFFIFLLLFS